MRSWLLIYHQKHLFFKLSICPLDKDLVKALSDNLSLFVKHFFSCPSYARNGCYTGTALHSSPTGTKTEVYKGCSTFNVGEEILYHNETLQNGIEYNLAKSTCYGTANCNVGFDSPEEPPEADRSCFVCSIQKDHLNNTIGAGDESCWGSNPSLS